MTSHRTQCNTAVAVVLAAGFSRRFGANDKRTARLANGLGLLAACVVRARKAFDQVCVVLREEDSPSALGLAQDVPILRAPRACSGLGASLGDAFTIIQRDPGMASIDAAAILLGDMPDISVETLQALHGQATHNHIVRPVLVCSGYNVQPGHPVIFGRNFWQELAELDGDEGAKEVILRHQEAYRTIEVDDPGVCHDIDTPAALEHQTR